MTISKLSRSNFLDECLCQILWSWPIKRKFRGRRVTRGLAVLGEAELRSRQPCVDSVIAWPILLLSAIHVLELPSLPRSLPPQTSHDNRAVAGRSLLFRCDV
jgi:hypothetical protein